MTENEAINGWTFEETIQTTENLMEVENNVFKWDVLRHLRDFAESFKDELEQYRAIGTVEGYERAIQSSIENYNLYRECKAKVQKFEAIGTIEELKALKENRFFNFDSSVVRIDEKSYNKAIDEFLRKICEKYTEKERMGNYKQYCCNIKQELADIAEKLKGGVK